MYGPSYGESWACGNCHRQIWARSGFALVTIISMALLVWTGIRATNDTEKQQASVGAGFSGLHTDISGLKTAVAQRPPIIVQSPPLQTPPARQPLLHAEIKVTRIEFISPDPQDGSGDIVARVIYQNLGDITGYAPAIVTNAFVGQPMARDKFDETMSSERNMTYSTKPPQNTEMDPKGMEAYYNIARIKASDWNDINNGKQTFYAWVTLESTDKNLPSRSAFISEFAIVKSGGDYQIDRNKTYFHAIKPH